MNESEFSHWLQVTRSRRLSPTEEARLQESLRHHPEMLARWLDEASLNAALDQLPDPPVPSNFTALVLAELDRSSPPRTRRHWFGFLSLPPCSVRLQRLAAALVLIGLFALGWHEYTVFLREQSSHNLVRLSFAASSAPEPALFKDFDAIRHLPIVPSPTDEALFDVLTQ